MEDEISKAATLYRDGKSLDELAKEMDMCYTTLRNRLKTRGVVFRSVGPRQKIEPDSGGPDAKARIARLYSAGLTGRMIAKQLGVPYRHVFSTLRQLEIPIRLKGHPRRSGVMLEIPLDS